MRLRISQSTSVLRVFCCLAGLAAAAAGCGASQAADPGKRVGCLTRAEVAAATPLIARLYAHGKLGTPAQFKRKYFPDVPRRTYLDGSGRLKRWSSITSPPAAFDLGNLITDVRLSKQYGRMIEAAQARARSTAKC
jgi:hypothetical protein